MDTNTAIAKHSGQGFLEQAILSASIASGKDTNKQVAADLPGVGKFHQDWRTEAINLGPKSGPPVLGMDSGIGGPARLLLSP